MVIENTVNISVLGTLGPILAFLLVFIVVYGILRKSSVLAEESFVNLIIAFIVATIFAGFVGVRDLVLIVVPWFSILLVGLFFIMVFASFIGKPENFVGKGIFWVLVGLMGLILLISGFGIFSDSYLSGFILHWIYTSAVGGTFIFILIAGLVSWVLVRGNKK
jgi:hypothetical protein